MGAYKFDLTAINKEKLWWPHIFLIPLRHIKNQQYYE
jgi:hypothetical protein